MNKIISVALIFLLQSCNSQHSAKIEEVYKSENLIVNQMTDNVFEHISYLNTDDFGKVDCNGMIVADGGEAVIFDTPADNEASAELLDWLTNELNLKVTAIVPTHWHNDNLGGLVEFHKRNIPSYAYFLTADLAEKHNYTLPQNAFTEKLELPVGTKKVYAEFIGEGHTLDNTIGYFPHDKALFGGCLLKAIGAGKGNTEDGNVNDWAETVEKVKVKYPDSKIVIPGHGKSGGIELIDYTINLFK
jgi:metallo-beta-lactamase class B